MAYKGGVLFSSEYQPSHDRHNTGRKKSLYKMLQKQLGEEFGVTLSFEDYIRFLRAALEMSPNQLKTLADKTNKDRDNYPMFFLVAVSAISNELKTGGLDKTLTLLNTAYKNEMRQNIDITTNGESVNRTPRLLTKEEAKEFLENFENEY